MSIVGCALLWPILALAGTDGVVSSDFIFGDRRAAPTTSCHASTIAEVKPGTFVAAWFGGTAEGKPDVTIWFASMQDGHWTEPRQVADGVQADGSRQPCWNPVLLQYPDGGPLVLFYKVGPNPRQWWGMLRESNDGGLTWSAARKLPAAILGPIKDKPILIPGGRLLCPSSTEDDGWRVHLEWTADRGQTWSRTPALNDPKVFGLIQPTLLDHGPAGLQMLCRSRQGIIVTSWSSDGGATWGAFEATPLPNPNSGIDAVQLRDGRSLLVYNHATKARSPLNVAISSDGKAWRAGPVLESEAGEYSYPAVIQSADGLVHVTYTWKRQRIKHVVIDSSRLVAGELIHASGK